MGSDASDQGVIYDFAAPASCFQSGRCFAAGATGLLRSDDGGKNWSDALSALGLEAPVPVGSVAVSPSFPSDKTVCAGSLGGFFLSIDGGNRWKVVTLPSPPPFVTSVVFSPNYERDGRIFAGTLEDGVFVSIDRGDSWHAWNFGLLDLHVLDLAVSSSFSRDETIFAAVESGIFRSTNGGLAWREMAFDIELAPVLSLALSPRFAEDGIMFAGTEENGLFKSEDGGESWKRLAFGEISGAVNAVVLSPQFPSRPDILVLVGGALFVSRDGGDTWRPWPLPDTEVSLTAVAAPGGLEDGAPLLVGMAGIGPVRI